MKGSFRLHLSRVLLTWCSLLASSRHARSVSFLHGSNGARRSPPRTVGTAGTTSSTALQQASPDHKSSTSPHSHPPHRRTRRRTFLGLLQAAAQNNATATLFPWTKTTAAEEGAVASATLSDTSSVATRPRVHVSSSSTTTTTTTTTSNTNTLYNNNNNNNNIATRSRPKSPSTTPATSSQQRLTVHTYRDDRGRHWQALNAPKNKFLAFLHYHRLQPAPADILTTEESAAHADRRAAWRKLWTAGQLLTERTDYFAVYPSDQQQAQATTRANRGGFTDLLHLYTQRLLSFVQDEQQDQEERKLSKSKSLYQWLLNEYGAAPTKRLTASRLHAYPPSEQEAYWKDFLEWFRERFPYYYDRCEHCGASIREDLANHRNHHPPAVENDCSSNGSTNVNNNNSNNNSKAGHKTFLGYVHPLSDEIQGKASRTELYQCHKCGAFTRFPRYNSAWHVMAHARGRCGEYSLLLFRLLRALGHETRWVVDWADHVWVEVFSDRAGAWIHLDPCEAAVHENYLYQGWGKKQTYVLAFYAPLTGRNSHRNGDSHAMLRHTPLIEDITTSYTTDTMEEIQARRDEIPRQIKQALQQSAEYLRQSLEDTGVMMVRQE